MEIKTPCPPYRNAPERSRRVVNDFRQSDEESLAQQTYVRVRTSLRGGNVRIQDSSSESGQAKLSPKFVRAGRMTQRTDRTHQRRLCPAVAAPLRRLIN